MKRMLWTAVSSLLLSVAFRLVQGLRDHVLGHAAVHMVSECEVVGRPEGPGSHEAVIGHAPPGEPATRA
jgi:hypothetical protein